jgi:ABC-2 type transport system ATP-binding protein
MITISNLTKYYGKNLAVNNISFTINENEILGFLGPNGAGKSTTMNMISGYLPMTKGTVTIYGNDISKKPMDAKKSIGYLPEIPPVYPDMKVKEYLKFCAGLKKIPVTKRSEQIDYVMRKLKITDVSNRLIKHLSKGYRQRVGFAQALLGNPKFLILDEPTVGLDPTQVMEVRRLIQDLAKDHTIIFSTHILAEVTAVCERVVIINQGTIVAQDTLENLTKNISDTARFRLRVAGPEREVQKLIRSVPGTRTVDQMGVKEPGTFDFLVETDRNADVRRPLFTALAKQDYPILMLRPMDIELEDIFLQLTTERGEE